MHLMPVPLVLNRVLVVEKFKTQVFRDLQDGANIRHPLHIKQFRRAWVLCSESNSFESAASNTPRVGRKQQTVAEDDFVC